MGAPAGLGSQAQPQGLDPMGPRGPCRPLPTLSSWQMKEPKQSSPALSNPLAPRDQTHPQPA